MARGRELSQLGSLINVEDSTKNIGVVHAAPSQKIGIGTISPTSKVDVRGDVVVTGIVTAAGFVGTGTDGSVSFVNKHETLTNKTLTAPVFQSGSNSPQFLEQRFVNANTIRFSQVYGGGANGSYFTQGEYQKICTIIPDGDSQNYTFIARITSTSASSYQIVYFSGALRSNTLPDLSFTTNYYQEHNGTAFIEPKLFTKETSTAGFIIAFEYIHSSNLYGNITCDVDIIPRSAAQRDNVTINTTQNSEQTSVDTGYTENDATLIYTNRSGVLEFGTQFRFEGATADGFETTVTATDPTADRTITFPDSSGTVALVGVNAISNVVEDTTPQLGGTLDVNSNDITGTGNVNLTGVVTATSFVGDVTGNADTATSATNAQGLTGTPNITVGVVTATSLTAGGLTYPTSDGNSNQVLKTDGSGALSFSSLSDLEAFDWDKNQDLGLVTDSVSQSEDLGSVTESTDNSYDLGAVSTSGVVTPQQFVLPSYTVSTLPAPVAGGMIFVTDETGGSIPAFSDGTNWRRVTDRAIVS